MFIAELPCSRRLPGGRPLTNYAQEAAAGPPGLLRSARAGAAGAWRSWLPLWFRKRRCLRLLLPARRLLRVRDGPGFQVSFLVPGDGPDRVPAVLLGRVQRLVGEAVIRAQVPAALAADGQPDGDRDTGRHRGR